uniref:endomucin n=1 Tax=Euleptes europaea TaxID=460621 RepID=UPI00253F9495|nr:endomucin [Euleptes europaea]
MIRKRKVICTHSTGSSPTTSSVSAITATLLRSVPTSSSNGNKTSQTTLTSVQVLPVTNNSTSTTGTTHSLPLISKAAASKLTPTTIGPTANITEHFRRNDTHPESTSQNTTQSSSSGNTDLVLDTPSYTGIILPVIIALIAITLSVCILVALYRICWKTTPERQENETEHTSLDKENVKLISVKTTSPESGEHSSQGKNKTRQHDDSSSHLGNK